MAEKRIQDMLKAGTRFLPFVRSDEASRMVFGYLTTEDVDSYGTVFTVEATREALQEYRRWRTLREMHQAVAAGIVPILEISDERGLWIGAKVVDDQVWEKVRAGVYKGFSIGFDPLDGRWEVRGGRDVFVFTRYILVEASLVDRNSNPGAVVTLYRAEAPYMMAPADMPWMYDHKADTDAIRAKLGDEGLALALIAGCPVAKLEAPGDGQLTLNRYALEAARAALEGAKDLALTDAERAEARATIEGLLGLFARGRTPLQRTINQEDSMDEKELQKSIETGVKGFFGRVLGFAPGKGRTEDAGEAPAGGGAAAAAGAQAPTAKVRLTAEQATQLRAAAEAAKGTALEADFTALLGRVEEAPKPQEPSAMEKRLADLEASNAKLTGQLDEALKQRKSADTVEAPKTQKSRWGGAFAR